MLDRMIEAVLIALAFLALVYLVFKNRKKKAEPCDCPWCSGDKFSFGVESGIGPDSSLPRFSLDSKPISVFEQRAPEGHVAGRLASPPGPYHPPVPPNHHPVA